MIFFYVCCEPILAIVFTRTLTALKDLALSTGSFRCEHGSHFLLQLVTGVLQLHVLQQIRLPHKLVAALDAFELFLCIVTQRTTMIANKIRRDAFKYAKIATLAYALQSMHGLLMLMQLKLAHTAQLAHTASVVCGCTRRLGLLICFRVIQLQLVSQLIGYRVVEHRVKFMMCASWRRLQMGAQRGNGGIENITHLALDALLAMRMPAGI